MIKKSSPPSPEGNLFPPTHVVRFNLQQIPKVAISFAFTLLCLALGITSTTTTASAQTRAKRASAKAELRARRVNEGKRSSAPAKESSKLVETDETAQPHVRKTALSYPVRNGNQVAERPALTNDIVIISRAKESPTALNPLAPKAGAAASSIPSIWPVMGTLRSGVGVRRNPFGGSSLEYHKGQDISAPMGTPVNATADGVVVIAGWLRGYGQVVYIDHGNGISTRYGHLSRIDVAVGQMVKRGGHLGLVGSTGRSTGPHLHYEVRINGQPTSPLPYLPALEPAASPAATQGQGLQH
jgi:murein DD-endopeptidase MepM/ murein hydrolase activator NlpD